MVFDYRFWHKNDVDWKRIWVQTSIEFPFHLIRPFNFLLFPHHTQTEKQIDLSAVDLKKLKVRDLKKILNDWDEICDGCLEKTDYIRRIEELKPKYYKESPKTEL